MRAVRARSDTSPVLVAGAVAVVAAGVAAGAWAGGRRFAETLNIERGRNIYAIHCAACHGAKLEGQPDWQTPKADGRMPAPPHDESGHTWHHGDRELFLIVKKGMAEVVPGYESEMPAFKDTLTDDGVEAVIAFIKSV